MKSFRLIQLIQLIKLTLGFSSLLLLGGCASLNSDFDCPVPPGVHCKSVEQINTMVNQGLLNKDSSDITDCPTCKDNSKGKTSLASISKLNISNFNTPYSMGAVNPGDPVRYGETVMRVWMAPYQDNHGNYYQPTVLYTVIKPGRWLANPVQAVTNED